MHAIQKHESAALNNDVIFNCSKEELLEIVEKYKFDKAYNYNMLVALPPERERTKHGIIIPHENSETEQFRTSIGRVLSVGSTVGDSPSLRDCKDIQIGDYVKYAFYAAGRPENYKGIKIKYVVDDQVKGTIQNPDDIDKLYDY